MIPLSLYVHIPWCIRKCPYCDFNSHQSAANALPEEAYVDALLSDLQQDLKRFPSRPLHSIFIGGGTPSLFSPGAYARLFSELRRIFSSALEIEITLEANPGTVESARFSEYRAIGINRLSLGIQSFQDHHLKNLGRIHDASQAHKAIETARGAGFDNINLDLMYGLPTQTIKEALFDLQTAMSFQPEHLSWYQLTLEPNTVFYKKRPPLPSDDCIAELEDEAYPFLQSHQFERYEISAFSKPQKASRHNMNYWLFGDYLGIGAGAHGKLTTQTIDRTRKFRQPMDYLDHAKGYLAQIHSLDKADQLFEFMLNATRLNQRVLFSLLTQRTQLSFSEVETIFQEAQQRGLLEIDRDAFQVTALGRRFTNDLQALFLPHR